MNENNAPELLKIILINLNNPEALANHPWALSAQVSGEQLIQITLDVFRRMLPPSPPRDGKRLDTRWGAHGILAAQYFAPFLLRMPVPTSLRNAWDSIDQSILLFVFENEGEVTEDKKKPYRFAVKELQPAPNSTLNDWHRRGVEQLARLVQSECTKKQPEVRKALPTARVGRILALVLLLIFLTGIALMGFKAWRVYLSVLDVRQKVRVMEKSLSSKPSLEQIPTITSGVNELRTDIDGLQAEVEPFLWAAKYGAWIPEYGGTIQQAETLLQFARNLIEAADDGLAALSPAIQTAMANDQPLEVLDLVLQVNEASPKLFSAQIAFSKAQEARKRLQMDLLLPEIQQIILGRIDPLISSVSGSIPMEDALTLVGAAPELLGSGKSGPQTYLLLMQNEDELRPTGGFLTAVGLMVVREGKIISMKIESSDRVDDFSKPYPIPPWQFKEIMNIQMFLLRDSNWFTDFPTTVSWAEYFYSYNKGASANGVITMDMHVLAELLKIIGPVRVEGVKIPISSKNVQEYLRSAEQNPPPGVDLGKWDRKKFIADLAGPILEQVINARGETWSEIVPILIRLLDEKHMLLQFDNEVMTEFLKERNWDGAVRIPKDSDFLMVVDTNMGYNKTNAKMKMALEYLLDLETMEHPVGTLSVEQKNLSQVDIVCEPFSTGRYLVRELSPGEVPEPLYTMDECHWGYLRVYLPRGSVLTYSTPRQIPETATMLGQTIPARIDDLGSEDIENAQVFGTMTLTPTKAKNQTIFKYSLPGQVISYDSGSNIFTYKLKIQKQPGILQQNVRFSIRLPAGFVIQSSSLPFEEIEDRVWEVKLDLQQDLWLEVKIKKN